MLARSAWGSGFPVAVVAGWAGRGVCPAVTHDRTRPAVRQELAVACGLDAPHQCREPQKAPAVLPAGQPRLGTRRRPVPPEKAGRYYRRDGLAS